MFNIVINNKTIDEVDLSDNYHVELLSKYGIDNVKLKELVEDKNIKSVVIIPNKLINIVV